MKTDAELRAEAEALWTIANAGEWCMVQADPALKEMLRNVFIAGYLAGVWRTERRAA